MWMEGKSLAWSIRRSWVSTTAPLEEFSKGMTPKVAVEDWTAANTSAELLIVKGWF